MQQFAANLLPSAVDGKSYRNVEYRAFQVLIDSLPFQTSFWICEFCGSFVVGLWTSALH